MSFLLEENDVSLILKVLEIYIYIFIMQQKGAWNKDFRKVTKD